MNAKKVSLALSLTCLFYTLAVFPAFAEDWKLSASATFESGKYGTGTTTDSLYVPVTLKRYFDTGDISVTVPYVMLKSNGLVTLVNGMPLKNNKKAGRVTTNSGLGDIIVHGSLYAVKDQPLDVSLVGKVKLPTADKDKGLGTGEFDETVGVELGKTLSPKWSIFADGYYTFTGSPPGQDLKNIFSFDLGVSDRFTQSLTGSLFYYESTPLTSGTPDVKEVMANLEYKISDVTRLFGGVSAGLSTSSPDYGVTGGMSVKF
jgi:hypothetical protein